MLGDMMKEVLICPICKTGLSKTIQWKKHDLNKIDCPNCGEFLLADIFYQDYIQSGQLKSRELATLSYAIHRMQRKGSPPLIVETVVNDIFRHTSLPNVAEQLDNLILFLGRELNEPGEAINLNPDTLRAKLGAIKASSAAWTMAQAYERGLIQGIPR